MVERNAGVPPERRIEFRIGIHLGDVVEESDGDLMGDGVNIAARLEGIAKPGAICLSEDAYRQVKGRLDLAVTDLGPTQLKNIAEPIRVYSLEVGQPAQAKPAATVAAAKSESAATSPKPRAFLRWPALAAALALALLAAGAFAWRAGYAPRFMTASVDDKLATAPRLSIVVLPFENLSGDKEQDYFADGITDDLTTDLSHLPDSFVIARNTAFTYKGKPVDAKQIGRELGVRYVLEGSVRRVGEKITVNAQLISTETGAHVWADRFDGERSKLGELQVEFVSRLANSLGVELVKAESLRAMRERPNNPDAVDLAMRGRGLIEFKSDKSKLERRHEPVRARARSRPAECRRDDRPGGCFAIARDQSREQRPCRRHRARGEIDRCAPWPFSRTIRRPIWRKAGSSSRSGNGDRRSRRLKPRSRTTATTPTLMPHAGFWKMFLGRSEDGFAGVETALRLSPRDPRVPYWQFYMCHLHTHLAQWEQAIEWCNKSIARQRLQICTRSSTSPPPTPGPATTRRRRRPSPNCRRSIPASPCRPGRASTGPTIRPSTRNTRASSRACARRGCRRGRRRRIEAPAGAGAMLVACRLAGLSALERAL